MPFSKSFYEDLAQAAAQLGESCPKVKLRIPFMGFYVTLHKPDIDEKKIEVMSFKEIGLEREGTFFLVMQSIWGRHSDEQE
jgi:hypothetical protein